MFENIIIVRAVRALGGWGSTNTLLSQENKKEREG
jgi:hypothetical protein